MREPTMKWFFEPRRDDDGARQDEDDSASCVVTLPAALLQRHGARVLDPAAAVAVRGYPTPRSTIYRTRTLLVPGDLLQDHAFIAAVNRVLERAGMNLVPLGQDQDTDDGNGEGKGYGHVFEALRRLSRPAVLVPAEGSALPVEVDAWKALQTLRAATTERARPELDETAVQRIALEHLLIGSIDSGATIGSWGGGISPGSGSGNDATGPSSTDSYLFSGGDPRTPVAVLADAPKRRSASECLTEFGRRPVVAVLDTGLRAHHWLDVEAKAGGGYQTTAGGFTAVDHDIQKAIYVAGELAATSGDWPREVIRHPWDTPVVTDPLVGELAEATGHGTFIAGIVG